MGSRPGRLLQPFQLLILDQPGRGAAEGLDEIPDRPEYKSGRPFPGDEISIQKPDRRITNPQPVPLPKGPSGPRDSIDRGHHRADQQTHDCPQPPLFQNHRKYFVTLSFLALPGSAMEPGGKIPLPSPEQLPS